uniref:Uncharacterized protein n=1 Tax=Ciona savignyi TaxID=51511 RepID=H2YN26_CIOSA
MADRRKSAKKLKNDEVINMAPISSQDVRVSQRTTPYPSAGEGTLQLTTSAMVGANVLDELTYKDLDSLKELKCPMAEKKRIRRELLDEHRGKSKASRSTYDSVKWNRFKEDSKDVFRHLELWRTSLH